MPLGHDSRKPERLGVLEDVLQSSPVVTAAGDAEFVAEPSAFLIVVQNVGGDLRAPGSSLATWQSAKLTGIVTAAGLGHEECDDHVNQQTETPDRLLRSLFFASVVIFVVQTLM